MRYRVTVEVEHLAHGDPLTEDAASSLEAATLRRLRTSAPGWTVEVALARRHPNMVLADATLGGKTLASPLDALTRLDMALVGALGDTGLFEEFDVVRRIVHAAPAS
jgi:hypothetical protein